MTRTPEASAASPGRRHRGLQALSIALLIVGFAGFLSAIGLAAQDPLPPELDPTSLLLMLIVSGVVLVAGLLLNAIRSIVARRHLPEHRYRGPSIWIMFIFALLVATAASIVFLPDAQVIEAGEGRASVVGSLVLLTVAQLSLVVLTAVFVLWPRALPGVRWIDAGGAGRAIRLGVLIGVPAWIGVAILAYAVATGLEAMGVDAEPQAAERAIQVIDPAVALVATMAVAPVAEELFFRGVVFNAWTREYGYKVGVIGSSILFGVVHLSLAAFLPITLLGVLLVWIYQRTGNLLAPIALHATFNGISVVLSLLVRYGVISGAS